MADPNPFLPEVTAFALTLHGTRAELVQIAQEWADRLSLYVALERFFPTYAAISLPVAADVASGGRPSTSRSAGCACAGSRSSTARSTSASRRSGIPSA